ncbi:MAG: hypothetical protein MJA83_13425, partial [Gammaproteobacteria bacterium]|nr:hypothetical protein [Gammaproteobacteria bacterium]
STAEGTETENTTAASRNIMTHTERVLSGVEVADIWRDESSGQYHVLTVMPRSRAAQSLRQEIASHDEATRAYLQQSRNSANLLTQISAASKAVEEQRYRHDLQKALQAIDATGRGVPSAWSLGRLEADLSELLLRISVTPQTKGQRADELQPVFAGALANSGFTVASDADYIAIAELDYKTLPPRDGWHWIRGVLRFDLETQSGASFGSKQWPLKVSATDRTTAQQRLITQVGELLNKELRGTVIAFAND